MVYISPIKVAHIVDWDRQGKPHKDIAASFHLHHTTVTCILKQFEKSKDYYHINPKTGRPRKMDLHQSRIAVQIITKTKAANTTEVQK